MTPDVFAEIGEALYGRNWKAELAEVLRVDVRTVHRWVGGQRAIPEGLPHELRRLLLARGTNIDRLIHLLPPES